MNVTTMLAAEKQAKEDPGILDSLKSKLSEFVENVNWTGVAGASLWTLFGVYDFTMAAVYFGMGAGAIGVLIGAALVGFGGLSLWLAFNAYVQNRIIPR
jgi:hypothetical protein